MTELSRNLLQQLNNYIAHAHHVYTTTHKEYRTNMGYARKLELIAQCKTMVKGINQFSGMECISRLILSMKKQLREILPAPMNSSYQKSLQHYNEIISMCEEVLMKERAH